MLRVSDLDYELPEDRIAVAPAHPRDAARLLVVSRSDPSVCEDRTVAELPEYLGPGDAMVVNVSRVLPARLAGLRADTGGRVEGLFLGAEPDGAWRVMLKGRRMREGVLVALLDAADATSGFGLRLAGRAAASSPREGEPSEGAAWIARLECSTAPAGATAQPPPPPAEVLARVGRTPLPPYIRAARKRRGDREDAPDDAAEYQTVYASSRAADAGSVAAPTAGLHFTPGLLARLAASGVERAEVVLHVGTGTFKPVECEFVEQHPMHSEWCQLPASTAGLVAGARRVIAVGTTSARVLESFPRPWPPGPDGAGPLHQERWSNLLITPGHRWQNVDGLMTNFHLPRSTLMAMVAALLDERSGAGRGDGVRRLRDVYAHAIARGYRFYSFGDAMLVLP